MWHLATFKISVSLMFEQKKKKRFFYRISELMLPTLIQRYDKTNYFISRTKCYRLSGAKFYDCINTIYPFIKPFLDNKMSIFDEYGDFKENCYTFQGGNSVKIVLPPSEKRVYYKSNIKNNKNRLLFRSGFVHSRANRKSQKLSLLYKITKWQKI